VTTTLLVLQALTNLPNDANFADVVERLHAGSRVSALNCGGLGAMVVDPYQATHQFRGDVAAIDTIRAAAERIAAGFSTPGT